MKKPHPRLAALADAKPGTMGFVVKHLLAMVEANSEDDAAYEAALTAAEDAARSWGAKRQARRGGLARAKKLTPERRAEIARLAACTGTSVERSARAKAAALAGTDEDRRARAKKAARARWRPRKRRT